MRFCTTLPPRLSTAFSRDCSSSIVSCTKRPSDVGSYGECPQLARRWICMCAAGGGYDVRAPVWSWRRVMRHQALEEARAALLRRPRRALDA
eukprot:scaffold181179_cov33-Tisochrysis_lutea.AAC.2